MLNDKLKRANYINEAILNKWHAASFQDGKLLRNMVSLNFKLKIP